MIVVTRDGSLVRSNHSFSSQAENSKSKPFNSYEHLPRTAAAAKRADDDKSESAFMVRTLTGAHTRALEARGGGKLSSSVALGELYRRLIKVYTNELAIRRREGLLLFWRHCHSSLSAGGQLEKRGRVSASPLSLPFPAEATRSRSPSRARMRARGTRPPPKREGRRRKGIPRPPASLPAAAAA